ncbi:hypothetical protein BDN71DRAFT_1481789 [Pleurotus eryngii]|uniref:SWIM-type domain-containing protein n=1 Tax=Pleurotus eryngii TaxID=5323 RepID=A0A9P6A365_PLEER|nr:hypothetical protein BDN71DRAFT_1481789 [Pleurotus eryngii]
MENSQKRKCEALDAKKYKNTYQAPLGYGSEDDKGNEEGKGQVLDIVCKNLDNATPNKLVGQIQALFPQVTANQIHTAWTVMSEELWKQDNQQLTSAKLLMEDLSDDIEIFDVVLEDGVEQICWGMKQIAWPLIGKVVEVGLDATCMLAEFDNAGFPLSYCLLSTASVIEISKHTQALTRWITMLQDRYHLNPEFIHMDKDMAEISMTRTALREQLSQAKLTTTLYNVEKAVGFIPFGRMDSGENEGGRVDSDMATMEIEEQKNPNAVYLQITKAQKESVTMTRPPNMKVATLTIKLPSWVLPKMATASENANEDHSCRIFCPDDLQVQLVDMVELYFCVHPLIPGYAAPSAPGICCWAVKQMVDFCVANDLHEAWAYLCENWLKTAMILESHWQQIKKDFLHHFYKLRVDLLVWILVTKMAPAYYRKLNLATREIGRFHKLPSWRKVFKRDWKQALKTPITVPLNIKYRLDMYHWVCTCPHFSKSQFLLCKHLVQAAPPVEPIFFLEPVTDETKPGARQPAQWPCEDVDSSDESESNKGTCHQLFVAFEDQMKKRIDLLWDFVYGLEYQIQFQDHRFLQMVERQGGALFRLAEACQQ